MRNYIKKDLLDIFKTLYEAHESIKDLITKKNFDTAVSLLGDCQNTAVQIGDIIENSEGEGFCTIHFLEEYCEAAYEVSVGINDGMDGAKAKKHLDKALVKAEQSARADIPSRLEIVFMPYKAAMWDSLESVWIAADEDPDCDAYVVPMPYYDKNSDGSFGTFHYEGDLFPENVPITHYDAYNLENRHPDVIYIHNPYDYANNVTSVDPRFYSDKLKKVTECLVYIPYYASSGSMSVDYIHLPVYYNADYIVVQAAHYIGMFDNKLSRDKFVVTGSPKFDRVIKMCKDGVELPEEWKDKIADKKVYFYNTSLYGMLADTDSFLNKMEYVFNCFAKRDDCCILWRPHPLFLQTIMSMRKDCVDRFESIKQFFLDNNIGIYDETTDISRSVAIADAYIGDSGTSILSLFGVTGKQIFILENHITTKPGDDAKVSYQVMRKERVAKTKWFITVGDILYYSPDNDFKYSYICGLSDYLYQCEFSDVITVGKKVFACPYYGYDILQIDTDGIRKRYSLPRLCEHTPFIGAIGCKKYIFLIPYYYPAIVRFDTEKEEVVYIKENVKYVSGYVGSNILPGGYCVHKDKLYIGSPNSNVVVIIDIETCASSIVMLNHAHNGGSMTVSSDGELIWITPFFGSYIMSWNPDIGKVNFYKDMPGGFYCIDPQTRLGCFDFPFSSMFFDEENIYFAAYWACMCVKLNKKSGTVEKYEMPVDVAELYEDGYHYSDFNSLFYSSDENGSLEHYFFSNYKRRLFKFDSRNKKWDEMKISFERGEILEQHQGFGSINDGINYACMENAYNTLDDFISGNVTGKQFDKNQLINEYKKISENIDGSCGQKTYNYVKESCWT